MSLQNWQFLFQIIVFVGAVSVAIGGIGSNYFGKKIIEKQEREAIKREEVLKLERDEVLEELKNTINQIPSKQAMQETKKRLNELRQKAKSSAQRRAVTGRP